MTWESITAFWSDYAGIIEVYIILAVTVVLFVTDRLRPDIVGMLILAAVGLLLGLFVFGAAKAAVMPVHRWLPAAMVAPTPVSALLHAVAVVKAGVFTITKVIVYVFGIDFLFGVSTDVEKIASLGVNSQHHRIPLGIVHRFGIGLW